MCSHPLGFGADLSATSTCGMRHCTQSCGVSEQLWAYQHICNSGNTLDGQQEHTLPVEIPQSSH